MALSLLFMIFVYAVEAAVISSDPTSSATLASIPVATQSSASGNVSADYVLTGFDECVKRGFDINHIKDGFSEMIEMLAPERHDPFVPAKFPEYWGDDWRTSSFIDFWGPSEKSEEWREHIKGMVEMRNPLSEYMTSDF